MHSLILFVNREDVLEVIFSLQLMHQDMSICILTQTNVVLVLLVKLAEVWKYSSNAMQPSVLKDEGCTHFLKWEKTHIPFLSDQLH